MHVIAYLLIRLYVFAMFATSPEYVFSCIYLPYPFKVHIILVILDSPGPGPAAREARAQNARHRHTDY